MGSLTLTDDWTKAAGSVFWAEIAPCDHVVQIYENDEIFLDTLFSFVSGGINAKDSVIIIVTAEHLTSLNKRLELTGYNLAELTTRDVYFPLDAETLLSKFMVNDWPDERLFMDIVSDLIKKAKRDNRKVRAFGEMVAILWAKGQVGATVRLEQLWNKFCETQAFCLFCAYPQSGFTQDAAESVLHICSAHSKMISTGEDKGMKDIYYKSVDQKQVG